MQMLAGGYNFEQFMVKNSDFRVVISELFKLHLTLVDYASAYFTHPFYSFTSLVLSLNPWFMYFRLRDRDISIASRIDSVINYKPGNSFKFCMCSDRILWNDALRWWVHQTSKSKDGFIFRQLIMTPRSFLPQIVGVSHAALRSCWRDSFSMQHSILSLVQSYSIKFPKI